MHKRSAAEFQNSQPVGLPHRLKLRLAAVREAHKQFAVANAPGSLIGKLLHLVARVTRECAVWPHH
jgi:hypothetical protein